VRIDHIVWDWNGTLFNDGDALVRATIDAFAAAGLSPVTRALYQAHFARPISAFYDKLAGRTLSPTEQATLDKHFQLSYARYIEEATLAPDAVRALAAWRDAGASQSLLSMYPQEKLLVLLAKCSIGHYFVRIEGLDDYESPRKEPHLRRHLAELGVSASRVVLVGDSVDDVHAARACGIACVLYHPAEQALLSRTRVVELGVPAVDNLHEAVTRILAETRGIGRPVDGVRQDL
jgi:phosphoglycolate phosphatase-like HAD superfamily hydrolase